MEPEPTTSTDEVEVEAELEEHVEDVFVREWRTSQLERLGICSTLAQVFANVVDWHDVAALVDRGCSPELAFEILR